MDQLSNDFKFISPGHPIAVLRHFISSDNWIVFFEHEGNRVATYDGVARTPEEALEKFIKHRINGEICSSSTVNHLRMDAKI